VKLPLGVYNFENALHGQARVIYLVIESERAGIVHEKIEGSPEELAVAARMLATIVPTLDAAHQAIHHGPHFLADIAQSLGFGLDEQSVSVDADGGTWFRRA
jgi:hypothetical protein